MTDQHDPDRDNELFLESIIENIPNMIFVKEARELRFVRFNRAGEELLGYRREDLIGRNDQDFFPPEQAAAFTKKDREVLDGGVLVDIAEEPIDTAAGERWLHTMKIPILGADGEPRFLLGISQDITARKRNQEALARQAEELAEANRELEAAQQRLTDREAQLEFLLSHLPGLYWTASEQGEVRSMSGAHAAALPPDPVGQPLDRVLGADALQAHRAVMAGREGTLEFQLADRVFEARVEPLEGGGSAGLALDVTDRRRLAAEQLQVRLQKAQKLEVLGMLAGGIAHDFNNLLVSMLGHASLAMLKLAPNSPARAALQQVESSAERASELTRQLLAYSGKGRFVIEPVVLNGIIEEMATLLRVGISPNVELRTDFTVPLPAVDVDVAQMRQLVMNLITNASDAMEGGEGQIRIASRAVEADSAYLRDAFLEADLPAGTYVVLEVSDTGAGMDPETRARMFDPFFTTKERGHGLGLAAALGIVRGHKGSVRVYSEPGEGTCIQILLPAASGAFAPASSEAPAGGGGAAGRRATVLVVDDEPAVRGFVKAALAHGGLDVVLAEDGVQAVELLQDPALEVDVVLLDMTMPRMDGVETFRAIRGLRPGLPVVLSSGYNQQDATSRFVGKGLAGFLQKPYRTQDLLDCLRGILGG